MAATDRRLHWMNVIFPDTIDFPGNTDGLIAPSGLSAERPTSPSNGIIRYNTTLNVLEGYVNSTWVIIGDSGSGGVDTFTDLSDTPNSYPIGTPLLRVNIGQTGVEFVDGNTLFLPLAGGSMNSGASITMVGATIKGVPSPQFGSDVANKEYVDGIAAGLAVKESVHSATTGNIDLANQGLNGIDGHASYLDGDRILVKDQTLPAENGIYAAHTGPWTRTLDMDGTPANEVQGGTTTYVHDGTVNGNTNWVVINDGNVNVGTDPMNWSIISAGSTQNLWETISGDGGSVAATSPIDTLTIAGGTGISTAMAGSTLTVTNDSPNVTQNVFGTITGDTGTAAASGDNDVLAIDGDGSTIATSITGSTLTISAIGSAPTSRIQDADNNTYVEVEQGADDNIIRFGFEPATNRVGGEFANWGKNGINIGSLYGNTGLDGVDAVTNNGGTKITITGGWGGAANPSVSNGGDGGALYMHGGDGGFGDNGTNTSGGDGGKVEIRGGYGAGGTGDNSGLADGGEITIKAGKGADSGAGGRLDILAGHGGSGDYATNGGAGGIITIVAGNGFGATNGGGISIKSGYGGNLSTAEGGAITIQTDNSNASGVVGPDVTIETGKGGSGAVAGNIVLSPGGYSGITHGAVIITATVGYANVSTELRFAEARNQGNNVVALKAPNSIAADVAFTLPGVDGVNGQPLTTDGSGTLGFSGPRLFTGSGTPEGVVTAPVGSIYTNSTGGTGSTLYIKESGAGNTGWVAK